MALFHLWAWYIVFLVGNYALLLIEERRITGCWFDYLRRHRAWKYGGGHKWMRDKIRDPW